MKLRLLGLVGLFLVLFFSFSVHAATLGHKLTWKNHVYHVYNGTGIKGQVWQASHVKVGAGGDLNIFVSHGVGGGVSMSTTNVKYQTFTVVYRMSRGANTKYVILLWPGNSNRPEVDFSEEPLGDNGQRTVTTATWHPNMNGADEVHFKTTGNFTKWHTAQVKWTPGNLTFLNDGKVFGHVKAAPTKNMHLAIQAKAFGSQRGSAVLQVRSVKIS